MSGSNSQSKQTQTTQQTSRNLNVQDVSGIALAESFGNTVNVLDGGAIERAFDFGAEVIGVGLEALEMGARVGSEGFNTGAALAGRGLDTAFAATERAIGFGETALSLVADTGVGVLQFTRDLAETNLSGLRDLAQQTSSSSDDRVTKIAIAAVVAFAIFAAVSRR